MSTTYTTLDILTALQAHLADARVGPYAWERARHHPSRRAIIARFGSWGAALDAALRDPEPALDEPAALPLQTMRCSTCGCVLVQTYVGPTPYPLCDRCRQCPRCGAMLEHERYHEGTDYTCLACARVFRESPPLPLVMLRTNAANAGKGPRLGGKRR